LASGAIAQTYSWVDEEGNVHYGDRVPPEYADQEQRILSREGVEIGRVERALTNEEREQLETLRRVEEEDRERRQRQAERDHMLLTLYATPEEVRHARDARIEGIRAQMRIAARGVERIEEQIGRLENRIAGHEERGEEVPQDLRKRYEDSLQQLRENERYLMERDEEMERVRRTFNRDMQRMEELRAERGTR
jgi:hypothetical protein